jgi:BirA family biotin operon repressor/biotin-[acetyl-CoA-carboxylase] ligase
MNAMGAGQDGNTAENIDTWSDRLHATMREQKVRCVQRAVVLVETGSTQDAARATAGRNPGLMLIAARQTSGRGRLGRVWHDAQGGALTTTLAISLGSLPTPSLSLAAGLAALRTIDAALQGVDLKGIRIGLRWPNDVIAHTPGQPGDRKLSGVLIEPTPDLVLVGIGINVLQREHHFTGPLAQRALSIAILGGSWGRLQMAERLLVEFDRALQETPEMLAKRWQERDMLIGTRRGFTHGRRRVDGVVEAIHPASHILVRTDQGESVELPALTTNLVHES